MEISVGKLQHIYDLHGGDFGLSGDKNLKQLDMPRKAIQSHLADDGTETFEGTYRGKASRLHYNADTRNVVVTDLSEVVVAAFKASAAQAEYIVSSRRLSR